MIETLMPFAVSFAVCGALCVIAQLLLFARATPPIVLNIFLILGGLLTPFGALDAVSGFAGFTAVICGAGNAFEVAASLTAHGESFMLIIVALLFLCTIVLGQCVGELRYRLNKRKRRRE